MKCWMTLCPSVFRSQYWSAAKFNSSLVNGLGGRGCSVILDGLQARLDQITIYEMSTRVTL